MSGTLIKSPKSGRVPPFVTRREWLAFLATVMERDAVMAATIDRHEADLTELRGVLAEHGLHAKPKAD